LTLGTPPVSSAYPPFLEKAILSELPYVKVEKKRRFSIIPSLRVSLNPGYEEFFSPLVEAYGLDAIYSAIKNLEKKF